MKRADTYPKQLLENRATYGDSHIAIRKMDLGIWNQFTWEDCYQEIKVLSLGLVKLGLKREGKVCICGDNDPAYYWAELATQAAGGIAVGIFADAIPSEIAYIADHCEASFVFSKDQEQCDKFLEILGDLPRIKKIIYWDPKGMYQYDDPVLMSFKEVQELGRNYDGDCPGVFEENIEKGKGEDTAIICYTSATTGAHPKGAILTYDYFNSSLDRGAVYDCMIMKDEYVSFAPGAWITEQGLGIGWWLRSSMKVNFPESPDTVQENIRDIGATFLLFGSRQWESLHSMVQMKISDTWAPKRWLYDICMPIGYKVADYRLKKWETPPLFLRFFYMLCNLIMFRPIRNYLGLMKLKLGITAGTILSPEIFTWFYAIGVPIKDMYGLTEALYITSAPNDRIKLGTSGKVLPGAQLKVSEEGEFLIKAENMCQGYHNNKEATENAFDREGWFHTGDAAFIDDDGYLIILDRLKDMMVLKDGTKYSPTFIENSLKFSPYIKDVQALGSGRGFVSVIITIDFDNVGRWAEKNKVPYTTFVNLSQSPEVCDLIQKDVERINTKIPENVKIKRFALLHKEFDPDEGELTRTRKLRRWFLEDKYKELAEAIYRGKDKITTEAEVKYRDGRTGKVSTSINIRDLA
jgi:long-chain acyl-CoA synthetase